MKGGRERNKRVGKGEGREVRREEEVVGCVPEMLQALPRSPNHTYTHVYVHITNAL